MTEFNADEIIKFLNKKLEIDISESWDLDFDGAQNVVSIESGDMIQEHTENLCKVIELKTEIEKSGWNKPSCTYCKKLPFDEYGMRDNCKLSNECFPVKENKLKHFQWRVSIEDFK